MADGLTLYTNPRSRGRIAMWMMEEIGQPFSAVALDFGPPMRTPEYLAMNPMGKVPVLKHGDAIVTETAAICAYMAETFPEAGLAPRPEERADYYRWMFFAAGPVEAVVSAHSMGLEAPPERRGNVGYGNYETVIDTLEAKFAQSDYVAGARFTAADVYVGSHVIWGLMFKTIPSRAAFRDYRERLMARPAYRRANDIA